MLRGTGFSLAMGLLLLGACQGSPRSSTTSAVRADTDMFGKRVLVSGHDGIRVRGKVEVWDESRVRIISDDGDAYETTPRNIASWIALKDQEKPAAEEEKPEGARKLITVVFKRDHLLNRCSNGLDENLRKLPDSLLFYEEDSRIGIRVPARGEHYHAHLFYRPDGGELREHVVHEGTRTDDRKQGNGQIMLDLAKFRNPEHLVLVTWPLVEKQKNPSTAKGPEDAERIIIPPFYLSMKLVPNEKADSLVELQDFRYEVKTQVGSMDLFVQPFNHADMVLTVLDRTRVLSSLLWHSYFTYRHEDAYLAPRVTAEVWDRDGRPWQRVGVWPVPGKYPKANPDDLSFALRTHRRELAAFKAPPQVSMVLPKERAGVEAEIFATYTGLVKDQPCSLVLMNAVPGAEDSKYQLKAEDHVVEADRSSQKYKVSLADLEADRFPLTAAVAHRFVQPWKEKGGLLRARSPRRPASKLSMGGGEPANIISPSAASHYFLVKFDGPSITAGTGQGMSPPAPRPSSTPPNPGPPTGRPGDVGSLVTKVATSRFYEKVNENPRDWIFAVSEPDLADVRPDGEPRDFPGKPISKVEILTLTRPCPLGPKGCERNKCVCENHEMSEPEIMTSKELLSKVNSAPGGRRLKPKLPRKMFKCCTPGQAGTVEVHYTLNEKNYIIYYKVIVSFRPCYEGPNPPKAGGGGFDPGKKPEDDGNGEPVPTVDEKRPVPAPTEDGQLPKSSSPGTNPECAGVVDGIKVSIFDNPTSAPSDDGSSSGSGHKSKCCCCCCCKGKMGSGVSIPSGIVEGQ